MRTKIGTQIAVFVSDGNLRHWPHSDQRVRGLTTESVTGRNALYRSSCLFFIAPAWPAALLSTRRIPAARARQHRAEHAEHLRA